MNPYYSLFYRLWRLLNKTGKNEMGVIYGLSLLVGVSLVILYVKIFPIPLGGGNGYQKIPIIVMLAVLWITNSILFLNKKRVSAILDHFKDEPKSKNRVGGILVVLYVVLMFIAIFIW